MDVASTRFGFSARDRDDLALQVQSLFTRFLGEYSGEDQQDDEPMLDDSNHSRNLKPKYSDEAISLLDNERNTIFIDFKDIELFDTNLVDDLILDYYRFYPYICRALAAFVREEKIKQAEAEIDESADQVTRTVRREEIKKLLDEPQIRDKEYYVGFYNFAQRDNIRELSGSKVGTLTRVTGQVVRTHSVHPELIVGCFKCRDCLTEQYAQQQFRYTQPTNCANENCANRTRFELILVKSKFTDFQRLRIQETQQELPRGSIPRSFDVVVRGADQVECIQPGDQCDFIGTLLAIPDVGQMMSGIMGSVSNELSGESGVTGLKSIGVKEMTYTLAFWASACIIEGQTKPCINTDTNYRENVIGTVCNVNDFTKEESARVDKMSKDPKLLDNLSGSLFSSIFGSDDIKRGIVLQLLGGVPKQTTTGTKLRGDINICLVGDPSTAKSQLLKIVTDFAPVRAVYASGKASSASGLTAAVVRDSDGGFVIEAGALMLADRGICCIDEFDKMDLKDQVAMHEAMEQQTISITKAGVTATLNARASILAAANPIGGCYNPELELKKNVNFSYAIMSRFDLFFTLIDPRDRDNDEAIASRIIDMHQYYANSTNSKQDMMYSFEDIRLYLRHARKYYPKIPIEMVDLFIEEYVRLRLGSSRSKLSWRITIRQLESLVRLSEALARAHCSEIVKPEYIRMVSKLVEKTIVHVGRTDIDLDGPPAQAVDPLCGGDQINQGMYEGEVESQRLEPSQPTQLKVTLSRAEYISMAEVLRLKLRQESESDETDTIGMKRDDLVNWYLQECVDEIATEGELIKRKELCEKVIDRLIKFDNILMEVREDGQIIDHEQESQQPGEDRGDRLIIINPTMDSGDSLDQIIA